MCGVFGIKFYNPERSVEAHVVKAATDLMSHRGPDDSGYMVAGNIGLGHRRLSIIDLSSGHQPMTNEDGRIITVYNGEIYNYQEIRRDLISRGHIFRTNCDTEVIVHAYEEWGPTCIQKFNGMFGIILWDDREKQIMIARDRLGVKPLYYYSDDNVFICASEIKSILGTGLVRSTLNENVLDAYFSVGYVPGPETMFKGIMKLNPGHYLLINGKKAFEQEYWDFANVNVRNTHFEDSLIEIEELLYDSVRKRLMSDVPLGVFLSGGLDSSVVVGLMSKVVGNDPINTFTIGYKEGYTEENYAQEIADRFSTNHHVFHLESDNFFTSLSTLIRFAEEPIVEPAAIALYHIAKLARQKAIVLLSGEGSDEVFAGYSLYQKMLNIEKVFTIFPGIFSTTLNIFRKILFKDKYYKYLDWLILPLSHRYQGTSCYLTPSLKKKYYRPEFFEKKSTYLDDKFMSHFKRVQDKDPLSQMLYVDTKTWLADNLLLKADKMTMAASIELRVPFLDYRVVEAVTAFPSKYKIQNGHGKYLLKKMAENILPNKIIYRKKMGFPVPTQQWFQGELNIGIKSMINGLKDGPWFNPRALDELLARHENGNEDNSRILMTLIVFAEWLKQFG